MLRCLLIGFCFFHLPFVFAGEQEDLDQGRVDALCDYFLDGFLAEHEIAAFPETRDHEFTQEDLPPEQRRPPPDRKRDLSWYKKAYLISLKSGSTTFADLPESKIIYGKQSLAEIRKIIGAHSARMLNYPEYKILSKTDNPDGTCSVSFRMKLEDKPDGSENWSKAKKSTLAPRDWDDFDIIAATVKIALRSKPHRIESDGRQFYRGLAGGIQWEVITDASGKITSSYPIAKVE